MYAFPLNCYELVLTAATNPIQRPAGQYGLKIASVFRVGASLLEDANNGSRLRTYGESGSD